MAFRHAFPDRGQVLTREPYLSWPIDWYDQVTNNGPLPVVAFLHGGGEFAADFLFNTFRIVEWWEGVFPTAAPVNIKAFAIALQGVGTNTPGGDWNGGNLGQVPRILAVDDVFYFFSELNRLEQILIADYNANHLPAGNPPITAVFDRARLMLVSFSQGGQLAYRLVTVAAANGWTITALCVFSSSIGGWFREADRVAVPPLPANVNWTPTVIPSLLHVHGAADPAVRIGTDGVSINVAAQVTAQVGAGALNTYARADICGQNSALAYTTVANATVGWAALGAGVPPALPVGPIPTPLDWDSTGGAVADHQVCFVAVPGMVHIVPGFAPNTTVDFLLTWGGL